MQQGHQEQNAGGVHFPAILYGGDYNPEQWITPEDGGGNAIWQEDLRLMRKAGVNLVTLGVFSWLQRRPAEDTFTFDWLDQIMDLLAAQDISVCLGTATTAQPAWLSAAYPDVLPTNEWGQRRQHGKRLNYCPTNEELQYYHQALWKRNITVDIISPDANLTDYDLVLAPLFNLVSQEQATAIEQYVAQGGTFLTTYFSGIVDEDHRAWLGGSPGPLRRVLGIWAEEIDPLPQGATNTLISAQDAEDYWQATYQCEQWCEVVHLEGARALSVFGKDFYAGRAAITEHSFGAGRALYIATRPDAACLDALFCMLQEQLEIRPSLLAPEGVEMTQRQGENE